MLKASLLPLKEGMHDVPFVSMRKKAFLLAKKKESSSSLKQKRKNFSFCEEQGKLFSLEKSLTIITENSALNALTFSSILFNNLKTDFQSL